MDNEFSANIVTNGIDISNIKFLKPLHYVLFANALLIAIICISGVFKREDALVLNGRSIVLISACWIIYEIVKKATNVFLDNVYFIPLAVSKFENLSFTDRLYKKGLTKERVYYSDKQQVQQAIEKIVNKLKKDINTKLTIILSVFMVDFCFLWGYLQYWDIKKALLFSLLGIPIGIVLTIIASFIYSFIKKRKES